MEKQLDLFQDVADDAASDAPAPIPGLMYVEQFLTSDEQDAGLRAVDESPWLLDLRRRVQHYGYRYDYKARRVDPSMYLGPLPEFASGIAEKLVAAGLFPRMPDQLIVNEYEPGQGITAHIDCAPCFGDTVAMISLGWAYEMTFTHAESRATESLLLAPGSALVVSGEARYDWLHEIKARKSDRGVPRRRRVSLTFRTVNVER